MIDESDFFNEEIPLETPTETKIENPIETNSKVENQLEVPVETPSETPEATKDIKTADISENSSGLLDELSSLPDPVNVQFGPINSINDSDLDSTISDVSEKDKEVDPQSLKDTITSGTEIPTNTNIDTPISAPVSTESSVPTESSDLPVGSKASTTAPTTTATTTESTPTSDSLDSKLPPVSSDALGELNNLPNSGVQSSSTSPASTIPTVSATNFITITGIENLYHVSYVEAKEYLSGPFEILVKFTSLDIVIIDLIGKSVDVNITFSDTNKRIFNGIVGKLVQRETFYNPDGTPITSYEILIYPSLWLKKFNKNYIIYNQKSRLDASLSRLNGVTCDIKCKLEQSPFFVQYGESDFDFVSRMFEHEGLFYYFNHAAGLHTMIIGNDAEHYSEDNIQSASVVYSKYDPMALNIITDIRIEEQNVSTGFNLLDYDFTTPDSPVNISHSIDENQDSIVKEFPAKIGSNSGILSTRLFESFSKKTILSGSSTAPFLSPGFIFSITDHLRSDINANFIPTSVTHYFRNDAKGIVYNNNFNIVFADTLCPPQRKTPKPKINGAQTAKVVGPEGEEVYTDPFGRILVTFPWESSISSAEIFKDIKSTQIISAKKDGEKAKPKEEEKSASAPTPEESKEEAIAIKDKEENKKEVPPGCPTGLETETSCWIRVSQTVAGFGWGGLFIPRIGQEVLVSFIEGDPDRPIVTGSVYNGNNLPPYLSEGAATSVIRTKSFYNDDGFNEIKFDDTKDAELFFIKAQKDMITIVGNDSVNIIKKNYVMIVENGNHTTMIEGGSRNANIYGKIMCNDSTILAFGFMTRTVLLGINSSEVLAGIHDRITIGILADDTLGLSSTMVLGMYDVEVFLGPCRMASAGFGIFLKGYFATPITIMSDAGPITVCSLTGQVIITGSSVVINALQNLSLLSPFITIGDPAITKIVQITSGGAVLSHPMVIPS
jgi:type VI secretion system secreted protein VgrG